MPLKLSVLIAAVVFSSLVPLGVAEDPPEMAKTLQVFYRAIASRYEFVLEDGNARAKIENKPIMSWTGQEAGTVSGDVFVWTHRGRPEVVGCIGSLPGDGTDRGAFHEFHSLTTKKSIATVDLLTGRKWSPATVGVKPLVVPESSKPAETTTRRMTQMRQIARQFETKMRVTLQLGERAGSDIGKEKLRLLPHPLYRVDADAIKQHPTVIDGAIFTYVWPRGTDPELLLLVEAKKTDKGLKWVYSPVRLTFRELWLSHKGKEVWHHAGGNGRDTYDKPYVTEFDRDYSMDEIKRMNEAK